MRKQTASINTPGSLAAAAALGVALALLLLAGVPKPEFSPEGDSLSPLSQEELATWMRVVRSLPEGTPAGVLLGFRRPDRATQALLAQAGLTPKEFASFSRRVQETLKRSNRDDPEADPPVATLRADDSGGMGVALESPWRRRLLEYAKELRGLKLRH